MPVPRERTELQVQSEKAVLAAVRLPDSVYDHADPFGELRSLAEQAGAVVVGELTQMMARPTAATFMGSGKVEELRQLCETLGATTVIFDHGLAPKQIANIEEIVERKVIDRSELILDIFAARATSAEAQLQVELAQLEYTYPRLKAMWTHLERIVGSGGIGGVGTRGPGEQQLEIDRRLVQTRRNVLEHEIKIVQERKRREVQKRKVENYTVGIVGYTNAGKSTLFNTLTSGGAYADNRLFATLMTRTRQWDLGGGLSVLLSDTVGFVRDLPHNLIAAFRATLEEATHADVLLIVLDIADPAMELQYKTVTKTLDELLEETAERERKAGNTWSAPQRIVLLNKADRLRDNSQVLVWQRKIPGAIPICALAGEAGGALNVGGGLGQAELLTRVRAAAQGEIRQFDITVPLSAAKAVHMLENLGSVEDRRYNGSEVTLRVRIGKRQLDQVRTLGARLQLTEVSEISEEAAGRSPARAKRKSRTRKAPETSGVDMGEGAGDTSGP